jgi:hypothetical protein
MDWNVFWHNLFLDQPIAGVTINTVYSSPTFRDTIVVLAAVVLAAALVTHVARGRQLPAALRLAALAAFFAAGLAASAHADRTWARWVAADWELFGGRTTEQKLRIQNGPLYDFAVQARSVIPSDYLLPNDGSDNYFARRFEYFALPLRKRPDAPYIVVLADREAQYDPARRTYTRGTLVIPDVQLVIQPAQDAYILRRTPPAGGSR